VWACREEQSRVPSYNATLYARDYLGDKSWPLTRDGVALSLANPLTGSREEFYLTARTNSFETSLEPHCDVLFSEE